MVGSQSAGHRLQPNRSEKLLYRTLPVIKVTGKYFLSDQETLAVTHVFRIHHRFGCPVRYQTAEIYANPSKIGVVEIHLSCTDLDCNRDQMMPRLQPKIFTILKVFSLITHNNKALLKQ